jgi:formate dehydrogenase subunit delta
VQFPQLSDPEAADAVAAHIRRFWDPRLRRDLQTYLGEDGDDLLPIAREAALLLRPA